MLATICLKQLDLVWLIEALKYLIETPLYQKNGVTICEKLIKEFKNIGDQMDFIVDACDKNVRNE